MAGKFQRYQEAMEILGLDMSTAFDTIRRDRLMHILWWLRTTYDLPPIADTTLEPCWLRGTVQHLTPPLAPPRRQPVTCAVHCVPRSSLAWSTTNDTTVPSNRHIYIDLSLDIAYADDVDFVSHSRTFLDQMERIIPTCLRHWLLYSTILPLGQSLVSRRSSPSYLRW